MSDYDYAVDPANLRRSPGYAAVRNAVLYPLITRLAKKDEPRPNSAQAYALLVKYWRMRLQVLAAAGWSALADTPADLETISGRRLQYYRNCPPVGVSLLRRANCCRRVRVCPWCHGRTVLAAYRHLVWSLFLNQPTWQLPGYKLVAVRGLYRADPPTGVSPGPDTVAWWASSLKHDLKRLPAALGYVTHMTLEPSPDGTNRLQMRRGTLVIVPESAELPELAGTAYYRGTDAPTRTAVGRKVAWAMQYPLNMFFGDAARTVALLHDTAQARAKFLAMGSVRPSAYRKDDPDESDAIAHDTVEESG